MWVSREWKIVKLDKKKWQMWDYEEEICLERWEKVYLGQHSMTNLLYFPGDFVVKRKLKDLLKCIKSWNFVKRQSHKQSDVLGLSITVYSMDCSQKTEVVSASQWCQMVIQKMVCEHVLQKAPAVLHQNSYLLFPEIFVFLTSFFLLIQLHFHT